MLHPTYREKTDKFRQLRNSFHNQPQLTQISDKSDGPLLPISPNDDYLVDIPLSPISPTWMQTVESIDENINQIENQIGLLKEYHSLRLRIIFDDNKENEYDINIQQTTHSIKALLHSSKFKLKEISNPNVTLGFQEKTARYNAMRSRLTKLQDITKTFGNQQRYFLQQIGKLNDKETHGSFDISNVTQTLPDLSTIYDAQYTQQQIHLIEEMERDASEREKKILEIAKSVHELATLFDDLSMLVVEQGSLLDRIDYNVEQTLETIENTVPVINRTNKIHKRSKSALCILVLILLIILCAIVLILRHI